MATGSSGLVSPKARSSIQPRAHAAANPAPMPLMYPYRGVALHTSINGSVAAMTSSCIDSMPRLKPTRLSTNVVPSKLRPDNTSANATP